MFQGSASKMDGCIGENWLINEHVIQFQMHPI